VLNPRTVATLPSDPPAAHLIQNVVRDQGHVLLFGKTGVGKSRLVWQMACAWGVGAPAFGLTPRKPLRVVFVEADMFRSDFESLIREMHVVGVVPPPSLTWFSPTEDELFDIASPFATELIAFNRSHQTDLTIYDAVPDLHTEDSIDARSAQRVLRCLSRMSATRAWLGVMTQRKASDKTDRDTDVGDVEEMHGSQGWARKASTVWQLTNVPSLVWVKHRLVKKPLSIQLTLGDDGIFLDRNVGLIRLLCTEAAKGYTSARELARRVLPLVGADVGDRTIRAHIADLENRRIISRL